MIFLARFNTNDIEADLHYTICWKNLSAICFS